MDDPAAPPMDGTGQPSLDASPRADPITAPKITGPWNLDAVVRHLESAEIPIRLATNAARGPAVQSLWFEFRQGAIYQQGMPPRL